MSLVLKLTARLMSLTWTSSGLHFPNSFTSTVGASTGTLSPQSSPDMAEVWRGKGLSFIDYTLCTHRKRCLPILFAFKCVGNTFYLMTPLNITACQQFASNMDIDHIILAALARKKQHWTVQSLMLARMFLVNHFGSTILILDHHGMHVYVGGAAGSAPSTGSI